MKKHDLQLCMISDIWRHFFLCNEECLQDEYALSFPNSIPFLWRYTALGNSPCALLTYTSNKSFSALLHLSCANCLVLTEGQTIVFSYSSKGFQDGSQRVSIAIALLRVIFSDHTNPRLINNNKQFTALLLFQQCVAHVLRLITSLL